MQHALTVQHENTHYWNITNYPFGFRTEIVYSPEVDFDAHKYHHICNEYMNPRCLSYGELNLANISIMTPEKGKVETLLGKSLDPELNEERKSLQGGISVSYTHLTLPTTPYV